MLAKHGSASFRLSAASRLGVASQVLAAVLWTGLCPLGAQTKSQLAPGQRAPAGDPSRTVQVKRIRFATHPGFTRVVVDLGQPVRYEMGQLTNPERLYVDLYNTEVGPEQRARELSVGDPRLNRIRIDQRAAVTRVVLDLKRTASSRVFGLKDPQRLVVDLLPLSPTARTVAGTAPKPAAVSAVPPPVASPGIVAEAVPKPAVASTAPPPAAASPAAPEVPNIPPPDATPAAPPPAAPTAAVAAPPAPAAPAPEPPAPAARPALEATLRVPPAPEPLIEPLRVPKLRIVTVDSRGAINSVKGPAARPIVVRVEDETERPVAGAIVSASLPDTGPSATFSDGGRTLQATTAPDGTLKFSLKPNKTPGDYLIRLTATLPDRTASAVIPATNTTTGATSGGLSTAAILAIIGGAAAAGVGAGFAVAHTAGAGGGTAASAASPTPTISIGVGGGGPTFGPR